MSSCRVFIGHLSSRAREEDVERFFEGYGTVRDINLKNGYGFVEFDDERDADDAVHDLDDRELCGQRVRIEHARGTPRSGGGGSYDSRGGGYRGSSGGYGGRGGSGGGYGYGADRKRPSYFNSRAFGKYGPPTRTEYRVIVENLSTRVSWQDLKDYLRQAGQVTYADAHRERRNEGVVEFASYKDMKNAISKLDDTEINGRRIRLVEYKWRASRSRSRSRRRTRSRSPRQSRSRSPRRSRSRSASRGRGSYSRARSRSRSSSKTSDRGKQNGPERSRSPDRHGSSRSRSRSASYEHANGGD